MQKIDLELKVTPSSYYYKENAEVRARIDNSDDALKVGMKAVAEIELGSGLALNNQRN